MIIEFIGLPGSGKTTLATACAAWPGWQGLNLKGRTYWYFVKYLFQQFPSNLSLLVEVFYQGWAGGMALLRWKLFLWASYGARTEAAATARKRAPRALIALDEGMAQQALSLFEGVPSRAVLEAYFRAQVIADRLVIVETDPEDCWRRMQSRGVIPRAHLAMDHRRWFEIYTERFKAVKTYLVEAYPDRVLVVRNGSGQSAQALAELKKI